VIPTQSPIPTPTLKEFFLPTIPPANPPPRDFYSEQFRVAVYDRSAIALHALRQLVGEDAFFCILHEFTTRYQHGLTSTIDFFSVAEKVSMQELEEFSQAWFYTNNVPPFDPNGLGD
jgi:aminopeptidase N